MRTRPTGPWSTEPKEWVVTALWVVARPLQRLWVLVVPADAADARLVQVPALGLGLGPT